MASEKQRSIRAAVTISLSLQMILLRETAGLISPSTLSSRVGLLQSISAAPIVVRQSSHKTHLLMKDRDEDESRRLKVTNQIFKASRSSFRHVEEHTSQILSKQPMLAMTLFVAFVLGVAYINGFIILEGYMSSANPMDNAVVPYWNEELLPIHIP